MDAAAPVFSSRPERQRTTYTQLWDLHLGRLDGRSLYQIGFQRSAWELLLNKLTATFADFEFHFGWWAGRESNPQSFRGGFTDRWARHVPFADPARSDPGDSVSYRFHVRPPVPIMAA